MVGKFRPSLVSNLLGELFMGATYRPFADFVPGRACTAGTTLAKYTHGNSRTKLDWAVLGIRSDYPMTFHDARVPSYLLSWDLLYSCSNIMHGFPCLLPFILPKIYND